MKFNKNLTGILLLIISVAALYRIIPDRPAGFAPQMALALFGGSMIKDKRWAFALPVFSLFISDLIYQVLFNMGLSIQPGFYEGQWQVYVCFIMLTVFGFALRNANAVKVLGFSIAGSVLFFIVSNFFVWIGGGGLGRPLTFNGLLQCYNDALLFYREYGLIRGFEGNFIIGELIFTIILFGGYWLISNRLKPAVVNS